MRIALSILIAAYCGIGWSQQDAQVSMYLKNPLQFNSAHAGLDGTVRATSIIRMQWTGWEGAPRTQFLSVHAPVFRNQLGVGFSATNDASGVRTLREAMGHVAYHSPQLYRGIYLSSGLSFGMQSAGYDFQSLAARHPNDAILMMPYKGIGFSLGAGLIIHSSSWFVGLSTPHMLEQDRGSLDPLSRKKRHLYTTLGYIYPLNKMVDLRLVSLVKWTANAPAILEVNLECWLFEILSVGAMMRWREGLGIQASYQFKEGWRFHYAIDFPTNGLMTRSFGSHEVGLAWDFGRRSMAFQSPRYF